MQKGGTFDLTWKEGIGRRPAHIFPHFDIDDEARTRGPDVCCIVA